MKPAPPVIRIRLPSAPRGESSRRILADMRASCSSRALVAALHVSRPPRAAGLISLAIAFRAEDGSPAAACSRALRGAEHRHRAEAGRGLPRLQRLGADAFRPTPQGAVCTEISGGPSTARVTGSYLGRPLWVAAEPGQRLRDRALEPGRLPPPAPGRPELNAGDGRLASSQREDRPLRRRRAPPAPRDPAGTGARAPRRRRRPQPRRPRAPGRRHRGGGRLHGHRRGRRGRPPP